MKRRFLLPCLLLAALGPALQAQIDMRDDDAKRGVFPPPNRTLLPTMLWINALTQGKAEVIRDLVEGGFPADARDAAGLLPSGLLVLLRLPDLPHAPDEVGAGLEDLLARLPAGRRDLLAARRAHVLVRLDLPQGL